MEPTATAEISLGENKKEREWIGLKEEGWQDSVMEIGSGGDGMALDREIREWLKANKVRFLSVDPNPTRVTPIIDTNKWALMKREDANKVLEDENLIDGIQEVWMRNPGGIADKEELLQKVVAVLPPGGRFIIYESYSNRNRTDEQIRMELNRVKEIFKVLNVEVMDYSDDPENVNAHPMLQRAGRLPGSFPDRVIALEIIKSNK